jgi:multiple sugar transport system permease protein
MIRHKNRKQLFIRNQIIVNILLIGGMVLVLVPFVWMIGTSLDLTANSQLPFPPRFFPPEPTFRNYYIGFNNVPMARYYLNTSIITISAVVLGTLSALLAGYAFSKIRFKFKRALFMIFIATIMIPFEMTAIPMWRMFKNMGLLNTHIAAILPYLSYVMGTFLAKQYFDTMPNALKESAFIDGASEYAIFWKIFFPIAKPIVATLGILLFIGSWNSFLWPLIVMSNQRMYTIQIGIALFTANKDFVYPGVVMALAVISIIPVVIVFLFFQKYIVESVALTGMKQ